MKISSGKITSRKATGQKRWSGSFSSFSAMPAALAALGLTLGMTAAQAQNAAVVNGEPLPSSRVEALFQEYTASRPIPEENHEALRSDLRSELINRLVLEQEAKRQGLQTSTEYRNLLDMARQTILVKMLFQKFQEDNKPSDAETKERYEEEVKKIADGRREYKARHILIKAETPEELEVAKKKADEVLKKLQDGADFAALAKENPADEESAKQGGELGWADAGTYVQPFAEALRKLKKGELTPEPVKTQFGYHIIRLDDVREQTVDIPPFEKVKEQVAAQILQERSAEFQKKLRDAADVK